MDSHEDRPRPPNAARDWPAVAKEIREIAEHPATREHCAASAEVWAGLAARLTRASVHAAACEKNPDASPLEDDDATVLTEVAGHLSQAVVGYADAVSAGVPIVRNLYERATSLTRMALRIHNALIDRARKSCEELARREWHQLDAFVVASGWTLDERKSMRRLGDYLQDREKSLQKCGPPMRDERDAWLRWIHHARTVSSSRSGTLDGGEVTELLAQAAVVIEDLVKRPNEWMRDLLDGEEPPFPDPPCFMLESVPFEAPQWFEPGHFWHLGVPTNAWTLIAGRNTGRHTALHRSSIRHGRRFLNLAFEVARSPTWIQPFDPKTQDFALVGAADTRTGYLLVACVVVRNPDGARDEIRIKSAYSIKLKKIKNLLLRPVGDHRRLVAVSSLHFEPEDMLGVAAAPEPDDALPRLARAPARSPERPMGVGAAIAFIILAVLLGKMLL